MSNNEESEKKAGGEETISKLLMLGAGPSEPEVRSMTIYILQELQLEIMIDMQRNLLVFLQNVRI